MSTSNPFEATDHLAGDQSERHREQRHLAVRILVSLVWFIPIHLLTNIVLGGILGAVAGAGSENYEAAYAAGRAVSTEFYQAYGLIILTVQTLAWLGLCAFGILPGTGKYKR